MGDILKRTVPLLKLYEKYVRGYERAATRLAECQRRQQVFGEWLDRTQAVSSAGGGAHTLESYLIMPVQRILR